MINTLDTLGLRVEEVSPITFANNIDINTEINIKFNSELDTKVVTSGVYILEDNDKKYIRNNKLIIDDYDIVPCTIRYKERTIFLRPTMPLKDGCRYIIYADKRILQDILGNMMITDYISYFDTSNDVYNICSIIKPENSSILPILDTIEITNTDCDRYNIQISKLPTFDNVIYDEIVDGILINKVYPLEDGMYYIRVKEENAPDYGIANVFSIKSYKSTTVSDQDIDEDYMFEPIEEEELKIIKSYPNNNEGLVNVKSNLSYMQFNKLINIDDVDFYESIIEGKYIDDTDKYLEDNLEDNQLEHLDINGHYVFVQDEENEETYLFFIPDAL